MSAFCSAMCNEISRCCYDCYHAPFTKKNLLIGGGVLLGLLVLIIIIVVASGGASSRPSTAEDILRKYPLVDGANSLSNNLKKLFMNQLDLIKDGLFTSDAVTCPSCQTDFKRLTEGHVATQVFSVTSTYCMAQAKDAVSETLEQIDLMRRIISENEKKLTLVTEASDIAKTFSDGKKGIILSVWGGHNIDSRLGVLRMFYSLGVRIMSIVSADPESTQLCKPPWVTSSNTLSDFGKTVILEMNRLGMMIDLSGSPTDLQKSVLSVTKAPVIFSHSGSLTKKTNNLNVDDSVLSQNQKNIAIVMVPFTPSQLTTNDTSTLNDVADHLDVFNNMLKDISKLGIGSNFDNMTKTTTKLEDVSKFVNLISHLKDRPTKSGQISWNEANLEKLISHNFIEAFRSIQKVASNKAAGADNIIPEDELTNGCSSASCSCYSDLNYRYSKNIPTIPTTAPTTTITSKSSTPK